MKSNLVTLARNPFGLRDYRRQTTALLAGLTLLVGTPFVLQAQSPTPEIARAVCISWPEATNAEQIVVGAESLASNAVWTPWPEPIFKERGKLCMAVPATASQQFFKLVPGTQFYDDFSDTSQPFTNRNAYTNS